jgi:hypothetical protein
MLPCLVIAKHSPEESCFLFGDLLPLWYMSGGWGVVLMYHPPIEAFNTARGREPQTGSMAQSRHSWTIHQLWKIPVSRLTSTPGRVHELQGGRSCQGTCSSLQELAS